MMPIVYTPTVGLACERFSHLCRRRRDSTSRIPARPHRRDPGNAASPQVEVIVVTDGERILGWETRARRTGDPDRQALALHRLRRHPPRHHPADPRSTSARTTENASTTHSISAGGMSAISGQYDAFIEMFVTAVAAKFPRVLLQWEDFLRRSMPASSLTATASEFAASTTISRGLARLRPAPCWRPWRSRAVGFATSGLPSWR